MPSSRDGEHEAPLLDAGFPPRSSRRPPLLLTNLHHTRSPQVVTALLLIIIFILAFGGICMGLAILRLFEDIVCHHYYNSIDGEGHIGFDEPIDEVMCKGDEVQKQLNILFGALQLLSPIPGLLTTIPYGLLADRIGRRPVFLLSMFGMIMGGFFVLGVIGFWKIIHWRWIWFSTVFMFIGGGEAVSSMTIYTIGCDITTEATRANFFLMVSGAALGAGLFAPSVASALMMRSPWLSLIPGVALVILGTLLGLFIPETLHLRVSASSGMLIKGPLAQRDTSPSRKIGNSSFSTTLKSQVLDGLSQIYSASTVVHSLSMFLLIFTCIISPFSHQAGDLSVRYISKRYSWKTREVGPLLSLQALVNIILLLVIIPLLSKALLGRLHFSSKGKDLALSRFSVIMLVAGAGLIGFSPTIGLGVAGMIIWTLGTGFSSLTRSLMTTLVDKQHIGRLNAFISVVETFGALIAGPMLNWLFTIGIERGGGWIGLPFIGLAVITLFSGSGVWIFGCMESKNRRYNGYERVPYGDEYLDDLENVETVPENTLPGG